MDSEQAKFPLARRQGCCRPALLQGSAHVESTRSNISIWTMGRGRVCRSGLGELFRKALPPGDCHGRSSSRVHPTTVSGVSNTLTSHVQNVLFTLNLTILSKQLLTRGVHTG